MSKATNVTAKLIEDGAGKAERAAAQPGAFYYWRDSEESRRGIIHSCPCGCGQLGNLNLAPAPAGTRPLWTNTGTRERPTLTPSVGIKAFRPDQSIEADGFHWHGWLRNGVWVSV